MTPINIQELKSEGRVYVSLLPEFRDGVEEAVEAWKAFCALPNEQKCFFEYTSDAKTSGNGYELKLDPSSGDLKEDFHLRSNVSEWLMEQAQKVDPVIAPRFIQKALALNELMAETLRSFAEAVEHEYHIPGFANDVMARQPFWLIRFLHYFGDRQPGDIFADPHVDKGGFTLHLYESHDGVECLTYDTKEWVPLPLAHDKTVIFAGMGLQHRSHCDLRALCHRVMANEDTADTGRYSAVVFINAANNLFYDKATFGRLQNWEPGAFYDMTFAELEKYFIA